MTHIVSTVHTYADGFGRWRARLEFAHPLGTTNGPVQTRLDHWWRALREQARSAIVDEIVVREQKVDEAQTHAEKRIRAALPPMGVINRDVDPLGLWHSVTFGES